MALLQAAPPPLKYTALLGDGASISAVAVDASGSAYIIGSANSALPVTPGAFQTAYHPATCTSGLGEHPSFPCPVAFAAKLTPEGTALVYLTYLGSSFSTGGGVSVDAQGNAWISGAIQSSDLPVTPGALQTAPKSGASSFVVKLNPSGSQALYASYFGGSSLVNPVRAQALDAGGNLYLAGYTASPDFPITSGAFQTDPGQMMAGGHPPSTGFVSKFDSTGKLVYSTYFHGTSPGSTSLASIALDASGDAYLTGYNTEGSLPTTPGAFQTSTAAPISSAFAAKLDPTGTKLVYCTYLAANSPDYGSAIVLDRQGNAYVAGSITPASPGPPIISFPITPGAFQTIPPAVSPAGYLSVGFVAKLNAAGSALVYSTYIGASDSTEVTELAVDAAGAAVMLGDTFALDFPTTPGALFQCNPYGGWKLMGYVLKLAPDGSQALYSTYLGTGSPTTLALDTTGEAYVAGSDVGLLPVIPGSFGWTGSGGFVASLAPVPLPAGSVSCVVSPASRGGQASMSSPANEAAIAPGEIVDILGFGIGPAQTVSASAVSGQVPTLLGGVQVLFGGTLAPLLSAGPNRIRAIVPFEAAPAVPNYISPLDVQILNNSFAVAPFTAALASLVPSIFTVDGKPEGQALMINQDGTLNSAQNPAPQGSIVTIYATGLNNSNPPLATGTVATAAAPLALSAQLQVLGGNGEITYAGAAPGFAAGLTQINFRLPASGPSGWMPLFLMAPSSAGSQMGVYFYEQAVKISQP